MNCTKVCTRHDIFLQIKYRKYVVIFLIFDFQPLRVSILQVIVFIMSSENRINYTVETSSNDNNINYDCMSICTVWNWTELVYNSSDLYLKKFNLMSSERVFSILSLIEITSFLTIWICGNQRLYGVWTELYPDTPQN